MHEYRLTKQISDILIAAAEKHGAKRVTAAYLVIGENTGIIPGCVQMYFDMIAKDTMAEGARLHVQVQKSEMHCEHCGKNFIRPLFSFECPTCGQLGSPTEIGNAFYVDRVELDIEGEEDEHTGY